jgi:chemosensory pili system protein ChpA (sensor histidine kinase/response regulator)
MARVDAELLDQLLTISGEASIARARLRAAAGASTSTWASCRAQVTRLKGSCSLEIETEAQILHKHDEGGSHRSEFDPLELDRYSSIQQYSRARRDRQSGEHPVAAREPRQGTRRTCRSSRRAPSPSRRTAHAHAHGPFQRHVQRPGARAPGRR